MVAISIQGNILLVMISRAVEFDNGTQPEYSTQKLKMALLITRSNIHVFSFELFRISDLLYPWLLGAQTC